MVGNNKIQGWNNEEATFYWPLKTGNRVSKRLFETKFSDHHIKYSNNAWITERLPISSHLLIKVQTRLHLKIDNRPVYKETLSIAQKPVGKAS